MPADYVAAFRTYTWNEDVRHLADRFFAACPSGRHVILADETRGPLGITGYEVISHTEDTSHLGLAVRPKGRSLWFNVDYGIYILRHALPGYGHYLLSESDLAVNLSLEPMMEAARKRDIDFIIHDLRQSTPAWDWHPNASAVFDDPWACILFFMVVSARAADLLLAARQRQTAALRAGTQRTWPFCEPFVASILKGSDLRLAAVEEFANTKNLRFRPRIPLDDPRANEPGSLVHSVLPRWDCFKEAAAAQPREWFNSRSHLRALAAPLPPEACAAVVMASFEQRMDFAGMKWMSKEIEPPRRAEPNADLAFCKPSLSSSISPWSHFQDPIRDAAGANGPEMTKDYGFHTAREASPWWMVDLMARCAITNVAILNRATAEQRFRQFIVESSMDSAEWSVRFVKLDLEPVSWSEASPFRIAFKTPFVARFIRIRLLGKDFLHLRRVRIFGQELAET